MAELVVLAPSRAEAQALGPRAVVTGRGAAAVSATVTRLLQRTPADAPIAVAGTADGLDPRLRLAQVVVASEVWTAEGRVRSVPSAGLLAGELRRCGLEAKVGPVVSANGPLTASERAELASGGALAVDGDSAWAAALADAGRPLAVVRSVAGPAGLAALRPPLERWGRASHGRQVVLAAPRSFCAGVERAIDIVERAIERYGAPVYVRRQIVHNAHVVADLAAEGAVFVDELTEVPDGATVVLAAHGVAPSVREEASARRGLRVVDATCPLVAKVHHEAKRFASQGYEIALVGHGDHEEVIGTVGEAPDRIHVVASVADVASLPEAGERPMAYLTQTTLATDETADVVGALRRRYPGLTGPGADDICYATQNRQDAVRAMAAECDLVLVVGSANSSNTARLVEVARRQGARAELVEDAGQLHLSWLDGARTVGLTAGASAPESVVAEVVDALGRLGPIAVEERRTAEETVRFALPVQVR